MFIFCLSPHRLADNERARHRLVIERGHEVFSWLIIGETLSQRIYGRKKINYKREINRFSGRTRARQQCRTCFTT